MSTYTFTIVIEPDEDVYHAYAPAVKGCHTFGKTIDEARLNLAEALELHLEGLLEIGEPIPIEHSPLFISQLSIPVV